MKMYRYNASKLCLLSCCFFSAFAVIICMITNTDEDIRKHNKPLQSSNKSVGKSLQNINKKSESSTQMLNHYSMDQREGDRQLIPPTQYKCCLRNVIGIKLPEKNSNKNLWEGPNKYRSHIQ